MKVSTNISPTDWSTFVKSHPDGTIFQSPEMFELFRQTENFEPLVLGAIEGNELKGILMGVFIHEKKGFGRLLSSRFVVYGGPLLVGSIDQKKASLEHLLKELIQLTKRKALFIQFRNFFSWEEHLDVFEKHRFNLLDRLNYIVRLPSLDFARDDKSAEYQIPNMSATRRRQIRKGLSGGAQIIEPENIDQVRKFYNILYKLYRFKVRKPLPDWSFFESFYQQSIQHPTSNTQHPPQAPGHRPQTSIGIIRLIHFNGKIIGGILAPVFENKCIYEWYVCGLDQEYKDQYPSVLATWAALEHAIENNIESFDFMGVGRPDMPYGVRDFKARFGGEQVNYGRLTRINNKFLYNIAELGYNMLVLLKRI